MSEVPPTQESLSLGAHLLKRTALTQVEISGRLSVGRTTVTDWLSGTTKPTADRREAIAAEFGIPVESWGQPIPEGEALTEAADDTADDLDVYSKARQLSRMARKLLQRVEGSRGATPLEQAKVMSSIAQTLSVLAKITGQYERGETLMRSPQWKRIERALSEGLANHPEAAAAVKRALQAAESDNGR